MLGNNTPFLLDAVGCVGLAFMLCFLAFREEKV